MQETNPRSFNEFWPFYLSQHSKPGTKAVHFIFTSVGLISLLWIVYCEMWWLLLLVPVISYGPIWASHFYIEKNRPATFKHPLWSFGGDLMLWYLILTQKIKI